MTADKASPFVPKLRFPEFRDAPDWEEVSLGTLLVRAPDYGVNAAAVPFSEAMPTYIRITDINRDGQFAPSPRVSVDIGADEDQYLKDGDIVLARTGASVGKSYRYREEDGRLVHAGFLIRVRPNPQRLLSQFLAAYLSAWSYWDWVRLTSARSGQPGINGAEYASMPLPLPPNGRALAEQQKIADCLGSLDDLIAAAARNLEAQRQHKQGLMQQIFPQPGETVPGLRFPEFLNGSTWDELRIGDVCDLKAGDFIPASEIAEHADEVSFPCYGANGFRGYVNSFTHEGRYVLVGRQGALCGNVNLYAGKFHATEHALVATPKLGVDTGWLFYALDALNLNRFSIGQAQPGLSVAVLRDVGISVPTRDDEQQKIADCLGSLDNLIAAQVKKLNALKTHKQGLLQRIFPSLEGH